MPSSASRFFPAAGRCSTEAAPRAGPSTSLPGDPVAGDARAILKAAGARAGLALNATHKGSDGYRRNNRLRQDNISGDLRLFGNKSSLAMKFGGDQQRLGLPGRGGGGGGVGGGGGGGGGAGGGRARGLGPGGGGGPEIFLSLGSYLDVKTK